MIKTTIATRVKPLGIQRTNVADNCISRAVLIDPNPQYKYIAFDETLRRRVEVDQDLLVRYGLKASPTFYYLIARLNCDMKGNVVSDDITVEYLQLSQNLQNEFSDAVEENPNFTSLKLSKVIKKAEGRDLSYIKVIPSNSSIPAGVQAKIEEMRSNSEALETIWKMIDAATSISAEEYIKLREAQEATSTSAPALAAPVEKKKLAAPVPSAPADFAKQNDFGEGFDTGSDFNF